MSRILVTRQTNSSQETLWRHLADLSSHTEWMKDAEWLVFVGDQTRGEGTKMRVQTVVGPFSLVDEMTVVGWDEGNSIDVEHTGLVKGVGRLSVNVGGLITWDETLRFPWWLGGPITAWFAKPILRRIWKGNLRRLDEIVSAP